MSTSPIYQPALERGLSIIPIPPREKGTKLQDWPERATNDAAIMEGLDGFNYGVVANDKFCILDIDNPTLFHGELGLKLPKTYTVATSRGLHLYFRHTDHSRKLGNRSAIGVFDFQADSKYVVGEGSTHPSGHVYACVDSSPIAEIPDTLVTALERFVVERKRQRVNLGQKAGDREDMLAYAGTLRTEDYDEDEMLEKLVERNDEFSEEPLSMGDLQRMVVSARKWEPAKTAGPVVLVGQPKLDAPAEECLGFDYVVGPKPDSGEDDNFEGWFPLGEVSLVFGASGAGKTTWSIQMLKAQQAAEKFFGHETFGLPWIMLMKDRSKNAAKRTFRRMKLDPEMLPLRTLPEGSNLAVRLEMLYKAEAVKPRLIFLEGLDLFVSKAKDADSWVPLLEQLQAVATQYNLAIIATVGSPKTKQKERYESPRDSAFGSQAVARMTETMVHVQENYDTGDRQITVMPRNARQERFGLGMRAGRFVQVAVGVEKLNEKAEGTHKAAFLAWVTPESTWAQCKGTFGDRISERTFYRWRDSASLSSATTEGGRTATASGWQSGFVEG